MFRSSGRNIGGTHGILRSCSAVSASTGTAGSLDAPADAADVACGGFGKNKDREVEAALFEKQSPSMTRAEVVSTLQQVAQISSADFDANYAKTLESVRADVQLGQKLGVKGTPTFYLNGIQLPSLRPAYFDAALDWAIRRFGTSS